MKRTPNFYIGEHKVRFFFADDCFLLLTVIIHGKIVSDRNLKRILKMEYVNCSSDVSNSLSVRYSCTDRELVEGVCKYFAEYGLSESEFWQFYDLLREYCKNLGVLSCATCPKRLMTVQSEIATSNIAVSADDTIKIWDKNKDAKTFCIIRVHKKWGFLHNIECYAIDLDMTSHNAYVLVQADAIGCPMESPHLLVLDNTAMDILEMGYFYNNPEPDDETGSYGCSNIEFKCHMTKDVENKIKMQCNLTEQEFEELCRKLEKKFSGSGCGLCE